MHGTNGVCYIYAVHALACTWRAACVAEADCHARATFDATEAAEDGE
jgi:hypothetical protein